MAGRQTHFEPVCLSLAEVVGPAYVDAAARARAALTGEDLKAVLAPATTPVDFYPAAFQERLLALLPRVGERIVDRGPGASPRGATTHHFDAASSTERAPINGYGYFRVGEDQRLYLMTKCEHYHVPLGHAFPGYRLVSIAKELGVPSATHNNTRGWITRRLEEELVCAANRISPDDREALHRIAAANEPDAINRVLNLETGSLAAEAALKMILARFYPSEEVSEPPPYDGRTPVFLVIGTDDGALGANYHGTTFLTQTMRGMWPAFFRPMEESGLMRVCPIRPNSQEDLEAAFQRYEGGPTKIAAFFHEIVMMNYGARRLTPAFLRRAYQLCAENDVATVVDEIQSCIWAPAFFLYHEYDLRPTCVVIGKGFPNGEYAASRILFGSTMDNLPQFGALVTNGQEELAALAYLVTMRWARANAEVTRGVGAYYEERLRELAAAYPAQISHVDGQRHLSTVCFHQVAAAKALTTELSANGLDVSVQSYKADCPPAVMMKLPLTAGYEVVDVIVERMHEGMKRLVN